MAMTEGHNKLKLANYGPKAEVIRDAVGYAMGLAETTLKAIPIFDADIQEGRNYFNALFSNILLSMCDIDRIER